MDRSHFILEASGTRPARPGDAILPWPGGLSRRVARREGFPPPSQLTDAPAARTMVFDPVVAANGPFYFPPFGHAVTDAALCAAASSAKLLACFGWQDPSDNRSVTAASVLIIDDDKATLLALPESVRNRLAGVSIDTCASPHMALTQIASIDYDAIVSDILMPEMDG
ncbi:MAG: response regulator, partial [Pirellulales bacterium]